MRVVAAMRRYEKPGRPPSVSIDAGNTGAPKTPISQARKVKRDSDIKTIVLGGDRGMISQTQIDALKKFDGAD